MADTTENRYSAKVKENSDILNILDDAKADFADALKKSNDSAKYAMNATHSSAQRIQDVTMPKTAGQVPAVPKKTLVLTEGGVAKSEAPKELSPENIIASSTDEYPSFDFTPVSTATTVTTEVSTVPDKVKDLFPGIASEKQPAITHIKTDIEEEQITIPDPVSLNPGLRLLPNDEEQEPLVVCSVMTNNFGKDWVNWEPETIDQMLRSKNLIPKIIEGKFKENVLYDLIFAIQLCYSHSGVLDFFNMFEKVINALNFIKVDMSTIQPVSPRFMTYGLKVIRILRPDLKDDKLGNEVAKYAAACCYQNGFFVAPGEFSEAQPEINKLINSEEYNDLANAIWNAERKLYAMTDADFDKTLSKFDATENPHSIQTLRNIAVINYVREKFARSNRQLKG